MTHEFSAFHRKPAPFGTWSGRYGGATVADWYAALSSRAAKDYWVIFRRTLDRHPGTTDLYAEICVGGANRISEAEFEQMTEEIFREIRRVVGPEIRIWATGMADWEGEVCSLAGPRGAEIAARLADHVVALGLAQRGPTLAPWKPSELESGLCHPNDAGEDRAAAEIVAFFTS